MKTITATEFKAKCLDILDHVPAEGIGITKRGKKVATLYPGTSDIDIFTVRFPALRSTRTTISFRPGWIGMLNLDTHIVVHYLAGALKPQEIAAVEGDARGVSAMVLWEIARLHQRGRIGRGLEDPATSEFLSKCRIWPLDAAVALASISEAIPPTRSSPPRASSTASRSSPATSGFSPRGSSRSCA